MKKILEENGFHGFKTIKELQDDIDIVPTYGGVYILLRLKDDKPIFLKKGTGGFYKNTDPNVAIQKLEAKWIEDSPIVYIGKAEKTDKRNLRVRLDEYMQFGQGAPVPHKGGRYIWQLKDASDLLVCWKQIKGNAEQEEKRMILAFKERYGKYPFANLRL